MPTRPANLPDFTNPPLNELYMSIQFERLPIDVAGLVMVWQEVFKTRYPKLEAQPPHQSTVETFSKQPSANQVFELDITGGPNNIRLWLISNNDLELLQLQNDRFIRNWRHRPNGGPYPRYETLRKRFQKDMGAFLEYMQKSDIECVINQCEISYVNVLRSSPGEGEDLNRRLGELIKGCNGHLTLANCDLESVAMNMAWVDRSETNEYPPARLRAQIVPAYTREGKHAFQFVLQYRGAPTSKDQQDILKFMDRGRDRIVNAFTEMTTEAMHKVWGRTN